MRTVLSFASFLICLLLIHIFGDANCQEESSSTNPSGDSIDYTTPTSYNSGDTASEGSPSSPSNTDYGETTLPIDTSESGSTSSSEYDGSSPKANSMETTPSSDDRESTSIDSSSMSPDDNSTVASTDMTEDGSATTEYSEVENSTVDGAGYDASTPFVDYGDQSNEGGSTWGYDYEEGNEEDKFGEELLSACRNESNYAGNFEDPYDVSPELKCFYACAMVRMNVLYEQDGVLQVDQQGTVELLESAFGDDVDLIDLYKQVVASCDQEVSKDLDNCEYAYSFIMCGVTKLQS